MGSITPPPGSEPFGETADTRFFWCGEARAAPMAQIEAAIAAGTVAIACAGAAGSGKTALLYKLAERLSAAGIGFIHPDRVVRCGNRASAGSAARSWEGSKGGSASPGQGADVLLLDDVDQLSRAEMAQLRDWWSVLREKREQVALVVSCAASAVDSHSSSRRQDLCSLIDTVVTLPALTHADIEEVIAHRLQTAGLVPEDVFAQAALDKVAFYAKGTPKRLVEICNRAMSLAEENGGFPIESDLVKEAAHQIYLPSHLREVSRKINMGLGPVPASLGANGAASSPTTPPPPVVETRYERRAYVEPRPSIEVGAPAALSVQVGSAKGSGRQQDRRTLQPDEGIRAHQSPLDDAVVRDPATAEPAPAAATIESPLPPPFVQPRRRRGIASVVVICGVAVVTGVVGYLAGQSDMKPVEVVRIIPHLETIVPGDAGDAGSSPAVADGTEAPSPAPDAAEPVPQPAEPAPEPAEPAADIAEPAPQLAEPAADVAEARPASPPPAPEPAAPTPQEGAEEGVPPAPSQGDTALATEAEDTGGGSSTDTTDGARKDEEPQSSEQVAGSRPADLEGQPAALRDEIANLLSRPEIGGLQTDDDSAASGPAGGVTAPEPAGTGTAAQTAELTPQDRSATASNGEERRAGPAAEANVGEDSADDAQGSSVPAAGETVARPATEQEPAIRWQFDRTVMRAQGLLAQLGLYQGPVDGLFGDRTRDAVREFQKSASMPATGQLSDPVLAALEQRASSGSPEPSGREPVQPPAEVVVDAGESLQVLDIMSECRGKDAEWVYIASINRHVLCGGLSAQTPNPVPSR